MESAKRKTYQAAPQCREVTLVFDPETGEFHMRAAGEATPGSTVNKDDIIID